MRPSLSRLRLSNATAVGRPQAGRCRTDHTEPGHTFLHPQLGMVTIDQAIAMYARHGPSHWRISLRTRMSWVRSRAAYRYPLMVPKGDGSAEDVGIRDNGPRRAMRDDLQVGPCRPLKAARATHDREGPESYGGVDATARHR